MNEDQRWICVVCGKAKELQGAHLKGKTTVRTDCWPCAKKREFKLVSCGGGGSGDTPAEQQQGSVSRHQPAPAATPAIATVSSASISGGTSPFAFSSGAHTAAATSRGSRAVRSGDTGSSNPFGTSAGGPSLFQPQQQSAGKSTGTGSSSGTLSTTTTLPLASTAGAPPANPFAFPHTSTTTGSATNSFAAAPPAPSTNPFLLASSSTTPSTGGVGASLSLSGTPSSASSAPVRPATTVSTATATTGTAPEAATEGEPRWICVVCGKAKELQGAHLKGKTTVRTDCWPCAKKREFKLVSSGGQHDKEKETEKEKSRSSTSETQEQTTGSTSSSASPPQVPANSSGGGGVGVSPTLSFSVPRVTPPAALLVSADPRGRSHSPREPQWRCSVCLKVKQLQGDHLKGKTQVRSDCWPCAKKRLFFLDMPSPLSQPVPPPPAQQAITIPPSTVPAGSTDPVPAPTTVATTATATGTLPPPAFSLVDASGPSPKSFNLTSAAASVGSTVGGFPSGPPSFAAAPGATSASGSPLMNAQGSADSVFSGASGATTGPTGSSAATTGAGTGCFPAVPFSLSGATTTSAAPVGVAAIGTAAGATREEGVNFAPPTIPKDDQHNGAPYYVVPSSSSASTAASGVPSFGFGAVSGGATAATAASTPSWGVPTVSSSTCPVSAVTSAAAPIKGVRELQRDFPVYFLRGLYAETIAATHHHRLHHAKPTLRHMCTTVEIPLGAGTAAAADLNIDFVQVLHPDEEGATPIVGGAGETTTTTTKAPHPSRYYGTLAQRLVKLCLPVHPDSSSSSPSSCSSSSVIVCCSDIESFVALSLFRATAAAQPTVGGGRVEGVGNSFVVYGPTYGITGDHHHHPVSSSSSSTMAHPTSHMCAGTHEAFALTENDVAEIAAQGGAHAVTVSMQERLDALRPLYDATGWNCHPSGCIGMSILLKLAQQRDSALGRLLATSVRRGSNQQERGQEEEEEEGFVAATVPAKIVVLVGPCKPLAP